MDPSAILDQKLAIHADYAVEFASNYGFSLDYTEGSITAVDELIEKIAKDVGHKHLTEEDYLLKANALGAYVGITLLKNLGKGTWSLNSSDNTLDAVIDGIHISFPSKIFAMLQQESVEKISTIYKDIIRLHSGPSLQA